MLTAAVTALTRTDDIAGVVLVGGSLTLLSWLVTPLWLGGVLFVSPTLAVAAPLGLAPALVARGYFVRVTRGAIQDGDAARAPSLVAWGELFRDGVKSVLLSAALLAPLAGGFAVLFGAAYAATVAGPVDPGVTATAVESALGPNGPAAVAAVGAVVLAAFVGAYLLAFAYLRPAALAAFAASGRLRDGLSPRTVADVAVTGPYATAWTLGVGALAVGYAVAAPTAPLVVGVALAFLVRIVAHGLYGRGAAGALTSGPAKSIGGPTAVGAARKAAATPTTRGTGAARESAATPETVTARGAGAARGTGETRDLGGTRDSGVTRNPDTKRSPPTQGMSGDGGRPMRSEPPSGVQVGRAVPIGDDGEGDADKKADSRDGTDSDGGTGPDDGPSPDGGFEWGPPLDDAEDKS
ncbi:DUF4013 domain-containing protein [Halorubrum ejinorense]|uniref:DUF4013 domain-containing protein n=1 Tax=Halorubrum ejinorense TaxID=425309 RepID=A0AAV3SVG8_9EURY